MHRKPSNDWGFTSVRTRIAALLLAVAAVIGAVSLGLGTANAAPVPAVAGNVTMLPSMVRVYGASNPLTLAAGGSSTTTIAGETFGGQAIPENTTGVTLSVSTIGVNGATGSGQVRVWTTGAPEPGTPAVFFDANRGATNLSFVALDSNGQINIKAVDKGTKVLVGIINYVTPLAGPSAPVVKNIPHKDRAPINVGGSIRTRGTELGSVTLTEGLWDVRAVGSFTGLNASTDLPENISYNGTFVLVKGDGTPGDDNTIIAPDFSNDITAAVPSIPRVSSATLTVDPTAPISDFITVPAGQTLKVTAVIFAAASDSSQTGSNVLKAGLDSATFVKIG